MLTETNSSRSIRIPQDLSDGEVRAFLANVDRVLDNRPPGIVLECVALEQVVSSHINLLWQAYLACKESGTGIKLKNASPGLVRILRVLDLYDFFIEGTGTSKIRLADYVPEEVTARSDSFRCDFPATAEAVDDALTGFLAFLDKLGLPEILKFELRTVFYETAMNIVDHSGLTSDCTIGFEARSNPMKIDLVFRDQGKPFDLSRGKVDFDFKAAARRGQKRGFGIAMIRRLTNEVAYERMAKDTNVLTLTRNWGI
ncbi:MAG: ATP-binding protein [candidate division Zixibacteria bacterium]|nr:ATP-binding protein [candidate division Zixibacteria bacterium]